MKYGTQMLNFQVLILNSENELLIL